jgi:hypothetical protein
MSSFISLISRPKASRCAGIASFPWIFHPAIFVLSCGLCFIFLPYAFIFPSFAAKLKPSMRADVYDTKLKLKFKGLEDHDYPFPGSIVQGDLTPLLLPGRGRLKL